MGCGSRLRGGGTTRKYGMMGRLRIRGADAGCVCAEKYAESGGVPVFTRIKIDVLRGAVEEEKRRGEEGERKKKERKDKEGGKR